MMEETKSTKTANGVEIPREWEIITLKDACIKIQDGNYGGDYPKQDEFFESGIPFLTSKAIGGEGEIIDKKIDFISEEKHLQLKKAQLQLNDVLFTNRGANVGTIGLVDERISHGNIGPQLTLLRANSSRINFLFLKEVMKSHFVQNQVRSQDSGSAMNFFGIGDTSKFKIPLPPLPEQKAIAQVLSTADAAIHTTEKLIAQKELRKKWLMQQLLTGKKRLKGFDGEVKLKVVEHFLKEVSERNKDLKITNVLSVTNSRGFINQAEQFDRVVASEDATNYKIVRKGQFAYNPSRVNVGSLDLLRDFESGILSPMYVVFETDKSQLLPEYFYYQLKTQWFYGHIPMFVQGSVRDSLSFDGLCSMKFFIPSIEEQTAIAKVLQTADKEISLLKAKAEKLREQKKGLMQQLLTGKVRLKI